MGARWWVVPVAAAFALVGGCAGSNDPGSDQVASLSSSNNAAPDAQAGDGKTDEDKAREFAQCMRQHGIDMPDPETNGEGGVLFRVEGNGGDQETMKKAEEECRPLLPNGGKPPQLDAEQLDKLREHAKCLREHGLDVPDPDPNNPGIQISADESTKEKVDAAMKACEQFAPGDPKTSSGGGSGGGESGSQGGGGPEPTR